MINIKASGVLFIGDPHLKSQRIGRRKDNFTEAVLNKLEQCINIANQNNYVPVILGDLFDTDDDNDVLMLTKVIRIFKSSKIKPITLVGNHEKTNAILNDHNPTSLLREAGVLLTMEKNEFYAKITTPNKKVVYLGGTPYGFDLPERVSEKKPEDADKVLWISHHDLAFDSSYPGAKMINEIEGVDILVNGHMHKYQNPVKRNRMIAFNPGNITRVSIDCKNHVPACWGWSYEKEDDLVQFRLNIIEDVFFLEGTVFAEAKKTNQEIKDSLEINKMLFAEKLKKMANEEHFQSQDASVFKEYLSAQYVNRGVKVPIQNQIASLLVRVLEKTSK